MRDVLLNERDKPMKVQNRVDGRKRKMATTSYVSGKMQTQPAEGAEAFELPLYGFWQTQPLVVKAVKDGVIPVNDFGNVEVWDRQESLVPPGARLISSDVYDLDAVRQVCHAMVVQHVDAVTGFERTGDATKPLVGGIVVLEESYNMVCDSAKNMQEQAKEVAADNRYAKIAVKWAKLVKNALRRQSLREKYGA